MARKASPKRREQFLDAALRLFAENGVQNTSTAAIAKKAGSAAGTLFLYFPTKQDLVNELILKISREEAAYVNSLLDPELSAREMLWTIWEGSLRWLLAHSDAFLYSEHVRHSELITAEVMQETAEIYAFYYAAIQKGAAEKSIKPYPPDLIGGFLYQDMVAVMNMLRAQPDTNEQDKIIAAGFDIFWNGIKAVDV